MDNDQFTDLCAWIAEAGLAGQSESATLEGFCERALEVGLSLARGNVVIDTLHPVYEGRAFVWKRKTRKTSLTEFGRGTIDMQRWENSPYYYLELSGEPMLRRRLTVETEKDFPIFPELRADGITDYVAIINRFAAEGIVGDMDCVYSSWATDAPAGFGDADVTDLGRLMPLLALALKAASLARIAGTLGRDLSRPRRRTARACAAASRAASPIRSKRCCGSAICAATRGSPTARRRSRSFRCSTTMPTRSSPPSTTRRRRAQADRRRHARDLSGGRSRPGLPRRACRRRARRGASVAAREPAARGRGPADDRHVSRAAYRRGVLRQYRQQGPARFHCRRPGRQRGQPHRRHVPIGRSAVLVSSAFASALGEPSHRLVSVGRYALRGVARAQELFTLEELSNLDPGEF